MTSDDSTKSSGREYWDFKTQQRKNFKASYCLHAEAGPHTCRGKVVKAHTIQRATSLNAIALNGHVFKLEVNHDTLSKEGGPAPREVGIHRASTFTGLCQYHDDVTFAAVEKQAFTGSVQQCFLLGYRSILRELHKKRAAEETLPSLLKLATANSGASNPTEFIDTFAAGMRIGRQVLERVKKSWDRILIERNFDEVRTAVVFFSKCPDIMTSSAYYPVADFDGQVFDANLSRLGKTSETPSLITYSIIKSPNGGAAVFCWHRSADDICDPFIRSLVGTRPGDRLDDAMVRLAFTTSDNVFASSMWWSNLTDEALEVLNARMAHGLAPQTAFHGGELERDGIRYVDWGMVRRRLLVTVHGRPQEIID